MPAKVLVVDDEANIRELVRLYLEKDGYQVHEAEHGEKAVALADELRPDLVVNSRPRSYCDLKGGHTCVEVAAPRRGFRRRDGMDVLLGGECASSR